MSPIWFAANIQSVAKIVPHAKSTYCATECTAAVTRFLRSARDVDRGGLKTVSLTYTHKLLNYWCECHSGCLRKYR